MIKTRIHIDVVCEDGAYGFTWEGLLPYALRKGDIISFCNQDGCSCEDDSGVCGIVIDHVPIFDAENKVLQCYPEVRWQEVTMVKALLHYTKLGFIPD